MNSDPSVEDWRKIMTVHNHGIDPSCMEFEKADGIKIGMCQVDLPTLEESMAAVGVAKRRHEDVVGMPSHYTQLPVEAIDITEHFNFCMGNALKYIWRADHKGNPIQDLKKAQWYIGREIERRERP